MVKYKLTLEELINANFSKEITLNDTNVVYELLEDDSLLNVLGKGEDELNDGTPLMPSMCMVMMIKYCEVGVCEGGDLLTCTTPGWDMSISCNGSGGDGYFGSDGEEENSDSNGPSGGTSSGSNATDTNVTTIVPVSPEKEIFYEIDNCLTLTQEQAAWVKEQSANFLENPTIVGIYNFTKENNCSPEAKNFTEKAIEKLMNDEELSFNALIIEEQIKDENLDPCSKNILNQLKSLTSNDIAKVLSRFGNVNSKYNWEIKTGTPTNPNNVFETNWNLDNSGVPMANNYKTVVNISYVNNATDLAIARVILHEAIHAYILSNVDDYLNSPSTYLQDNFSEVWNYYLAKSKGVDIGNIEDAHHEEMANAFIEVISNALAEFDNNKQDSSYYEYLAWGALTTTKAYQLASSPNGYLTINEQEAIDMANTAEDTNNSSAKGVPCN